MSSAVYVEVQGGRNRQNARKAVDMVEYTNSRISAVIDEHIHHAIHRQMLKDRLIDGMTYEQIAEKHDMSVRQTKNIIYKSTDKILKYL